MVEGEARPSVLLGDATFKTSARVSTPSITWLWLRPSRPSTGMGRLEEALYERVGHGACAPGSFQRSSGAGVLVCPRSRAEPRWWDDFATIQYLRDRRDSRVAWASGTCTIIWPTCWMQGGSLAPPRTPSNNDQVVESKGLPPMLGPLAFKSMVGDVDTNLRTCIHRW